MFNYIVNVARGTTKKGPKHSIYDLERKLIKYILFGNSLTNAALCWLRADQKKKNYESNLVRHARKASICVVGGHRFKLGLAPYVITYSAVELSWKTTKKTRGAARIHHHHHRPKHGVARLPRYVFMSVTLARSVADGDDARAAGALSAAAQY